METARELKQAVADYRAGRAEAFTMLYEKSSKYIYTCIYKVMNGNENMQDAIGDIMQDTYVEISRSIRQLGNEDSFLSWAGTIATRKCYAWLKKNRKYVLLNEEDDTFENLADDDDIIPEEVMLNKEKQYLVRQIIDTQLTQMQKICIISYYFNGQKQSEIARELGILENTVKTNLSRAKAKIKNGVLDLEKKQGTKLYSAAPLLLLLFKEEAEACTVPYAAAKKAGSVVSAISSEGAGSAAMETAAMETAAATGAGKALSGKWVSLSLKAKIAAGVIAAGIAAAVIGGTVYMTDQEKRDVWAPEEAEEESGERAEREESDETAEREESDETAERENFEEMTERGDAPAVEEEPIPMEQVPLSDSEKEDLKMLVSMLTLNSHFFGEDMDRNEYPVRDVGRGVQMITILGAGEAYEKYLPPVEIDETNWTGCVKAEDMRFYLETVFGIQDADLSAYCENDKVVCGLGGNMIETETSIAQSDALGSPVYEISGTCSVMEEDMVSTYPYCLTVARNEESVFGFLVMSMQYKDGEKSIPDHINTEQFNVEDPAAGEGGAAADIPVPYGTYSTNRGTELGFFENGKVMVSEGGSHKIFEFTIDGGGKLVIDPSGEALEGTYNAETDVIVIDMLKFRK